MLLRLDALCVALLALCSLLDERWKKIPHLKTTPLIIFRMSVKSKFLSGPWFVFGKRSANLDVDETTETQLMEWTPDFYVALMVCTSKMTV